jgi:hypothetical protein
VTTFSSETYQNEYLPIGGTEVNAIVTVTASERESEAGIARQAAEIIIIDVSGSMDQPSRKLRAAKEATAAAIDCIRDGVRFGVIAGAEYARQAYPDAGQLVPASTSSKGAAKEEIAALRAEGGTAIGQWLALANEIFGREAAAIKHAILLTDGRDESESARQLAAVLAACEGKFQCDCRGIGTDWEVHELRRVASTLLGSVDIVAEPEELAADFESMMHWAMGKQVSDVALRLWAPRGASIRFVKQVSPAIEDLTGRRSEVSELEGDYPTGAWGEESRDYHVCVSVPSRAVGEEMLAGRVKLVVDGAVVSQALIRAVWTEDVALSTRISREVAHYTGEAELAAMIQEGLDARRAGDVETATMKLGRAVQLADADGNEATAKLLAGVVEIEDAATGKVHLRRRIDEAEEMALDTRSTKTVRARKQTL